MQEDDADSTLIKTLGKVNENSTIRISCTTETFGFSHLRQGESSIPLTQELCWQKYFQTHFVEQNVMDRQGWELSLSLWTALLFWGDCRLNISGYLWKPHSHTYTLIFPYKPAPPNTWCIDSACSITPMQHSANQRIKKCVLYWKDSETKEKIVIHSFISIILSKENSDAESHLKFTMSFSLRFLKAQVGCRSSWGRCWRLSVALG